IAIAEIALVSDISGVWSRRETFWMTWKPTNVASMKTNSMDHRSNVGTANSPEGKTCPATYRGGRPRSVRPDGTARADGAAVRAPLRPWPGERLHGRTVYRTRPRSARPGGRGAQVPVGERQELRPVVVGDVVAAAAYVVADGAAHRRVDRRPLGGPEPVGPEQPVDGIGAERPEELAAGIGPQVV